MGHFVTSHKSHPSHLSHSSHKSHSSHSSHNDLPGRCPSASALEAPCAPLNSSSDGGCAPSFSTIQLSKINAPKGLGRAADSVPLNADGHMSPHLSSEDFCLRFASGMAELLLTAWFSPLILLAKKNFSDFFTVSLFHVNRSPFHGILDGASQCLLQMRMSTQPVEHPFLQ